MPQATTLPASDVVVTPYDDPLQAAHQRFAAKMWPSKRRRRESRYNRWKFRGPATGPVAGLLLAVSEGEVLGQLGLIPAVLSLDGQSLPCQWACDLMVDSSLRRRGIGSMLFEAALARGMITLGSNPSAAADVTMQRIGFRPLVGPSIAVFPLDPSHVLSWRMPRALAWATPLVGAALRPLLRWRGRRLFAGTRQAGAVGRGSWRSVAPMIAERQARQAEPQIVHGDRFLAWRCGGLPEFVDPLEALWTADGSYAIVGAGAPLFYVFDWAASSWEGCIALFATIRAMASEVGALTLQAYANDHEEREWLQRAGFLMLRQPAVILCHPPVKFIPRHSRMRYSIFDSDGNL